MMEGKVWRFILVGALATWMAACGKPTSTEPDAGPGTQEDSGIPDSGTDGGIEDAGTPGPQVTAEDSRGAYVPSPTRALLVGTKYAFFGTKDTLLNPEWFGRPAVQDSYEGWFRAGLIALDTTTGAARVYTEADGLPLAHLQDDITDYGNQTPPIFNLAWIEKDKTFAAAAWDFLVKGTIADDGTVTFQNTRVKAVGATEFAHVAQVAVLGDELFVGTDEGVAVLNATSLALLRWVDFGSAVTGMPWVGPLSAGTVDGKAQVGIVFGAVGAANYAHVALVEHGATAAQVFDFTDGSKPTTVLGMNGMMLVGAKTSDGRGAIYAIGAGTSGLAMDVMVDADTLSLTSYGPIVPSTLAWDPTHQMVAVGGIVITTNDGGLVEIPGSEDGTLNGWPRTVVAEDDPYFDLLPLQVDALAYDDQGRLYMAGRQICDETKLRNIPVYRLERSGFLPDSAKLVRPLVSGIRDLEVDPDGNTWLALSDADRGTGCFGASVGSGVCRLRADGACEIVPLHSNVGANIQTVPSSVDVTFGRVDQKELAVATRGDAMYVQSNDVGGQVSTQLDPGLSLRLTSAAYGEDGTLWVGSQMEWDTYNDPSLDEKKINARGPHGLGLLEHDDKGAITTTRRYVRVASDNPAPPEEIAGMPSDTVWAVLPLSGNRRALVALGEDRKRANFDHLLGELAPADSHGGVVLIEDTTVTPFTAPEGKTFGEVVALAQSKDGTTYALDGSLGVLKLDMAAKTVSVAAAPVWGADERVLSLAVDGNGTVAVGTSQGLYLIGADGGVTHVFEQQKYGFVWRVRFMADGVLYAGTDSGLVRLAVSDASLPSALGPESYSDRQIWPLPVPCGGVEGCACTSDKECAEGNYCACPTDGSGCTCQWADPCVVNPGSLGCWCDSANPVCTKGLICACSGPNCSCGIDPATCANGACACTDNLECPNNWYCNPNTSTCAERQLCDKDCSCSTANGCSDGLICQSGFTGKSCI